MQPEGLEGTWEGYKRESGNGHAKERTSRWCTAQLGKTEELRC